MASNKDSCPTGGSSSQVQGFHQVTLKNTREMTVDRLGVSTAKAKIECSISPQNNTGELCKNVTPGYAMMLDAKWDRQLVSTCGK